MGYVERINAEDLSKKKVLKVVLLIAAGIVLTTLSGMLPAVLMAVTNVLRALVLVHGLINGLILF